MNPLAKSKQKVSLLTIPSGILRDANPHQEPPLIEPMNSTRSSEPAPDGEAERRIDWLWPTGAAIAMCTLAGVPMLESVTLYTALPFALQCMIAAVCAWTLIRRMRSADTSQAHSAPRPHRARPWNQLLRDLLPVWHQHVTTSRAQIEEATTDLVANFSRITDEFESAGFNASATDATASTQTTSTLLEMCEQDLRQVVSALSEISRSKSEMSQSMGELAEGSKDLQAMAHGVAQIAAQTNLLAINAAIEAAHAGESGRGFATIAKEIRMLSQLSAQTAQQITEKIKRVTKIMHDTSDATTRATAQEESIVEQSSQAVHSVLTHMRQLSADAQTMKERGHAIRSDIEQLVVSMQFQDRVSQILSVVDHDIRRLKDQADRDDPVPEPKQWLQELQSHYTMRDQHQRRSETTDDAASKAPSKAVYF